MNRKAFVQWQGDLKTGKGLISTESETISKLVYTFGTRFENQKGTNPEELIAAAHASCFSMAVTAELQKQNFTPKVLDVSANLTLGKSGESWSIDSIHLDLAASVPEISAEQFEVIAQAAKKNCPVSKVLNAEITLKARLN